MRVFLGQRDQRSDGPGVELESAFSSDHIMKRLPEVTARHNVRVGFGSWGARPYCASPRKIPPDPAYPGFCVSRSASMKINWSDAAQSNCVP